MLLIISQSLECGPRRVLWAAPGIVSCNALWFALSALGIGAAQLAGEVSPAGNR